MFDRYDETPPIYSWFLGILHIVLAVCLFYVVFQLWPESTKSDDLQRTCHLFGREIKMHPGQTVLAIIVTVGVAGSFLHSANSFISYAGNRRLTLSWKWYYLLRPFMAGTLAFGFYLVIRGGLISVNQSDEAINLYGLSAVCFLAGMNTDNAIRKLVEVFKSLFGTTTLEDQRSGRLRNDE